MFFVIASEEDKTSDGVAAHGFVNGREAKKILHFVQNDSLSFRMTVSCHSEAGSPAEESTF